MPDPMRRSATEQVLIQLIEAEVETGFGLVDDARAHLASGDAEFSSRALQNATEIVADIERRLQQLAASEADPFLPLVGELRSQIAAAECDRN